MSTSKPRSKSEDKSEDATLNEEPIIGISEETLRDRFACMAMQGLVSRTDMNPSGKEDIARQAYNLADYMLIQRDFRPEIEAPK